MEELLDEDERQKTDKPAEISGGKHGIWLRLTSAQCLLRFENKKDHKANQGFEASILFIKQKLNFTWYEGARICSKPYLTTAGKRYAHNRARHTFFSSPRNFGIWASPEDTFTSNRNSGEGGHLCNRTCCYDAQPFYYLSIRADGRHASVIDLNLTFSSSPDVSNASRIKTFRRFQIRFYNNALKEMLSGGGVS